MQKKVITMIAIVLIVIFKFNSLGIKVRNREARAICKPRGGEPVSTFNWVYQPKASEK